MYRLFNELAHRYDLHTPAHHYQDDHVFAVEWARQWGWPCQLLDVGCGTGVFLEKARKAGINAVGIDAAPGMVRAAEARLGEGVVSLLRMEEIEAQLAYHAIVSLSWALNYCAGYEALSEVLRRFYRALLPGGGLLLQVAHADHTNGRLMEDREAGPGGEPDDVLFLCRFQRTSGAEDGLLAEYVYACKSSRELLHEQHQLRVADARVVAERVRQAGFTEVSLFDSFRQDAFVGSPSPFIVGYKPKSG